MAKLIIALNSGTDEEIVAAYKGCGASTKKNNPQFLLYSALCDFDQLYGNREAYKRIGIPEDSTLSELGELVMKMDEWDNYPSDLINL